MPSKPSHISHKFLKSCASDIKVARSVADKNGCSVKVLCKSIKGLFGSCN